MTENLVRAGTIDELPSHIRPTDIVLDVGGGSKPFSRANYVLDFQPWAPQRQQGDLWLQHVWPKPYFSKETWIQWDLCSRERWPFKDKEFDFVFCRHTVEDLRDPIWVCQELVRVAKSGYIETPSRIIESIPGIERSRYCGYSHHHWLCEQTASGLEFTFKHAQLHGYNRFHLCVGPQIAAASPNHNWMEILDPVQQLFAVVNRWFREIDPKYYALGLFWTGSFTAQEKILIDKGHVEADLMAFKERCRHIDDLWRWKRNWYGKRIRQS
ncbi:MAG: methyltransferase domain-containing protein [Nitrospira sp.]|nr:methyltransferase domain-containing protein [Nitrospira sp.]